MFAVLLFRGFLNDITRLNGKKTRTITRLYGFDSLHYQFKRVMAGDFWNSAAALSLSELNSMKQTLKLKLHSKRELLSESCDW
jgi:hypothetical protein